MHRRSRWSLLPSIPPLTLGFVLIATTPSFAADAPSSSGKDSTSSAHGTRSAKDLPKPLPHVVETVNKTAVEAGKELSKAGQVVKDAANKAYKNIKNGTTK